MQSKSQRLLIAFGLFRCACVPLTEKGLSPRDRRSCSTGDASVRICQMRPINKGNPPADSTMINQHIVEIRVRYNETDAMGFLHHSNYLCYFEVGRTELFRAQGGSYRRMEELGLYFVVAKIEVRYRRPARYDDQLTLKTEIARVTPAKLEHHYYLMRENEVLAEADSIIACVNRAGEVQRIPEDLVGMTTLNDHL